MMLDKGELLHQQQLLADEWEHQVQIVRGRLQAEAAMELLNHWSVHQTVRQLRRQTSESPGSNQQGESAAVAAMNSTVTSSSATTSASTINPSPTIQEVLRSIQVKTSKTTREDLQATRDAFRTQSQHLQRWFANNCLGSRNGPKDEQWYTRHHLLQETSAHLEVLDAKVLERERERLDSIAARRDNVIPAMPPQETLSAFQQ